MTRVSVLSVSLVCGVMAFAMLKHGATTGRVYYLYGRRPIEYKKAPVIFVIWIAALLTFVLMSIALSSYLVATLVREP